MSHSLDIPSLPQRLQQIIAEREANSGDTSRYHSAAVSKPLFQTLQEIEEKPTVTVPDFHTYATRYPNQMVATVNLNKCLVLSMTNHNRLGDITHRSITHFNGIQLQNPEMLKEMMQPVINSFKEVGGDPRTAEFVILGGNDAYHNKKFRENLRAALDQPEFGKDLDVRIEEPEKFTTKGRQSFDLFFKGHDKEPVDWWREKIVDSLGIKNGAIEDSSLSFIDISDYKPSESKIDAFAQKVNDSDFGSAQDRKVYAKTKAAHELLQAAGIDYLTSGECNDLKYKDSMLDMNPRLKVDLAYRTKMKNDLIQTCKNSPEAATEMIDLGLKYIHTMAHHNKNFLKQMSPEVMQWKSRIEAELSVYSQNLRGA